MNPVILPASNAGATSFAIDSDWSLAQSAAGTVATVADLDRTELQWQSARVPGTVAQVIEHAQCRGNLDDFDWWYRCDFQSSALTAANLLGRVYLCLDGLATIADVWLNNELILQSNNMFVVHRVDVTALLQADNQLAICFRSLSTLLRQKQPRPAWKTKLVSHQNLRWFRTTLLGRMPSWEPKLPAVGPWREIRIECVDQLQILESKLITRLQGSTGKVGGVFICQAAEGLEIQSASLQVGADRIPFSGISDDRAKKVTTSKLCCREILKTLHSGGHIRTIIRNCWIANSSLTAIGGSSHSIWVGEVLRQLSCLRRQRN
jgi:beta-mannosidase